MFKLCTSGLSYDLDHSCLFSFSRHCLSHDFSCDQCCNLPVGCVYDIRSTLSSKIFNSLSHHYLDFVSWYAKHERWDSIQFRSQPWNSGTFFIKFITRSFIKLTNYNWRIHSKLSLDSPFAMLSPVRITDILTSMYNFKNYVCCLCYFLTYPNFFMSLPNFTSPWRTRGAYAASMLTIWSLPTFWLKLLKPCCASNSCGKWMRTELMKKALLPKLWIFQVLLTLLQQRRYY